MSTFNEFVQDNLIFESFIPTVEKDELVQLEESLDEMQGQLNELFGLDKLGNKLKSLSDKGDKKAEELKKGAKETAEKAVDVAKGVAKDVVGGTIANAKEVAKSHIDMAKAGKKAVAEKIEDIKDKFIKLSGDSREAFKTMFSKIKFNELDDAQKKLVVEFEPIFKKFQEGKSATGADAIKVLALVIAGAPEAGILPKASSYLKALEKLRTTPGISSFKFQVKKA